MVSSSSADILWHITGQSGFSSYTDLTEKYFCWIKWRVVHVGEEVQHLWVLLLRKISWFQTHWGANIISKISFSESQYIMCILYRQTGISSSPLSLKCLRLLSLLISIRGKAGLITGNTVLLITSMCIASKRSGGRFSSHLHWCKSRVIELCHIESRRTALIGFSVSIKILLNSASDSVLSLFSFGSALISRV